MKQLTEPIRGTRIEHLLSPSPSLSENTMDKSRLAELKNQFRRAQGSVNYWNNAVRSARSAADKHNGTRREQDLARLADWEKRAIEAKNKLDGIKAQLTELDPKGARARQLTALRSAINRANTDIAHLEHIASLPGQSEPTLAHYSAKLNAKRTKLAQLAEALAKQKQEAEKMARNKQFETEHLPIASAPHRFDPYNEEAFARAEARQVEHMVTTDLSPPSTRHQH